MEGGFTRLTGGEWLMQKVKIECKRHWVAILLLAIVVIGLVVYIAVTSKFTISDAYARNVGWGTPLDFDVIRPEGMQNLPGAEAALSKN